MITAERSQSLHSAAETDEDRIDGEDKRSANGDGAADEEDISGSDLDEATTVSVGYSPRLIDLKKGQALSLVNIFEQLCIYYNDAFPKILSQFFAQFRANLK